MIPKHGVRGSRGVAMLVAILVARLAIWVVTVSVSPSISHHAVGSMFFCMCGAYKTRPMLRTESTATDRETLLAAAIQQPTLYIGIQVVCKMSCCYCCCWCAGCRTTMCWSRHLLLLIGMHMNSQHLPTRKCQGTVACHHSS